VDEELIIERLKEVISAWSTPSQLANYAIRRQGYGNSDGGFGVIYPEDLDEYDREVEGANIPYGHIEIYGYWHCGGSNMYECLAPEKLYLEVLNAYLIEQNLSAESEKVQKLLSDITGATN
jgi:hypothetical protein